MNLEEEVALSLDTHMEAFRILSEECPERAELIDTLADSYRTVVGLLYSQAKTLIEVRQAVVNMVFGEPEMEVADEVL